MNKMVKRILIAVLALIGLVAIISYNTPNTDSNKYGAEAVRILEKYKSFDIDAKEAARRLDSLMKEVRTQKNAAKSEKEENKLSLLWLDLVSIHTKLYHYGTATGYEIDEAIKSIKEHS